MEARRTGRLPWGAALLIAVAICALSVLVAYLGKQVFGQKGYGSYTAVTLTGNQGVQVAGDGFIYYNGSTLASVSSTGAQGWSYSVGANASFNAGDSGVAVWSGRRLSIIGRENGDTLYTGQMDEDILSAKSGAVYTAVLLSPEHDSTIVLLENGGREVDLLTFPDQTVLDYGFFSNDTLFWVMTLDTSGTVPTTSISNYRPGRMMVGSITDAQQLMYQVMFQSSQVVCAGTTHLKVYDYTGARTRARLAHLRLVPGGGGRRRGQPDDGLCARRAVRRQRRDARCAHDALRRGRNRAPCPSPARCWWPRATASMAFPRMGT